jgi:hypothetical protein
LGEERRVYKVLVRKHKVERPLGRPRHRWEDWIRMGIRVIGLGRGGCVEWFQLVEYRDQWQALVNVV